jgi:hypothetical protein
MELSWHNVGGNMKTLMLISIVTLAGVSTSLANLGDTEKELRARFAKKPLKMVEFTNTGGTKARALVYKDGAKTFIAVLLDGISNAEFLFPEPSEQELSAMRRSYSKGEWTSQFLKGTPEDPSDVTMWVSPTGTKEDLGYIAMYDTRGKGMSVMFRYYEEYGQRQGRFLRDQVHKLLKSSVPGY